MSEKYFIPTAQKLRISDFSQIMISSLHLIDTQETHSLWHLHFFGNKILSAAKFLQPQQFFGTKFFGTNISLAPNFLGTTIFSVQISLGWAVSPQFAGCLFLFLLVCFFLFSMASVWRHSMTERHHQTCWLDI